MLVGVLLIAVPAFARQQADQDPANPGVSPAELQRLFDSYALVQAQQFLNLSDDQYSKFLPRFMTLQNVRRQALQQHTRMLNELRRLIMPAEGGEDQVRAALKQLQDIDDRGEAEAKKAQEAVDQTLDLRQQARFRIFEAQMERRKLELVTIARQGNRANNPNRPNNPNRGR
jgi:hypothetical protein